MWLLNLDTGEAVPVPTPMDSGGGAFDDALGRRGWIAAKVEYQVGAYPDGADLWSPVMLPEAWTMLPAASEDLVLLRRYFGRSSKSGEPMRVAVADRNGLVRRSADLPWSDTNGDHVVGELSDAVVTTAGIFGWGGEIRPLPGDRIGDPFYDSLPVAVLGGMIILFEGPDYLESIDVPTGSTNRISVPEYRRRWPGVQDPRFSPGRSYDATGSWIVAESRGGIGRGEADYVVAGPHGEIRWLPGRPRTASLWVDGKFVQWSGKDRHAVEYDPVADRFSPADLAPMTLDPNPIVPRVEVTGRFAWPA